MCFNIYMNKCLYINLYGCTCILFLSGASSEIVNPAGWEWVRSPSGMGVGPVPHKF